MHPRLGALAALRLTDPDAKMAATRELAARVFSTEPGRAGSHVSNTLSTPVRAPDDDLGVPGRPERPMRVSATAVERRSPFTTEGRAALVHAICHIEFNAVKVAFRVGNPVDNPLFHEVKIQLILAVFLPSCVVF